MERTLLHDLDENRLAREVTDRMLNRVLAEARAPGGRPLEEVINETLFHERGRLERGHNGRSLGADRLFITWLRHELPRSGAAEHRVLLRRIIERYVAEIRGHFDPRVYAFATRVLPMGLTGLLNSLSPRHPLRQLLHPPSLDRQLLLEGEIDTLRALERLGTLVLLPTHGSNLDSPLIGYAIFRLGLPPFSYGAGLNLFTNPLISFFMRHLGAYTVDRRKTDPLYRRTLKEHATVLLESGQHNVFFPGGTRSRSGALESRLKRGLLGTGLTAYRNNLLAGRDRRLFFIPCTISTPLVLEAATLVGDFLEESGKARYIIADDEFSRARRWVDFLTQLLRLDLRIHVRIGRPFDPFGNEVDAAGLSRDARGRIVEPAGYLRFRGEVLEDPERDAEYTRTLAGRLVASYRRYNTALPTHAVAFAALELLRRQSTEPDLYRFLRGLGPESSIPIGELLEAVDALRRELGELADRGELALSQELREATVPQVVDGALRTFGSYHQTPVLERHGARVHVGEGRLVFFYRNRLEGYGLMGAPPLLEQERTL